jgi:hypothetical protein
LSEKIVPLASSCDKNPRMIEWFGRNQGKNDQGRVEDKTEANTEKAVTT